MIPDHGRDITDEYKTHKVPRLYPHQVEMLKRLSAIGKMFNLPDCPVDLGKSGFVLEASVKGKSQW